VSVKLSTDEIDEIHGVTPFNPLFPNSFLFEKKYNLRLTAADQVHYQMATWIDAPPKQPVSMECCLRPASLLILQSRTRLVLESDTPQSQAESCQCEHMRESDKDF
jgi:hypothetical protein